MSETNQTVTQKSLLATLDALVAQADGGIAIEELFRPIETQCYLSLQGLLQYNTDVNGPPALIAALGKLSVGLNNDWEEAAIISMLVQTAESITSLLKELAHADAALTILSYQTTIVRHISTDFAPQPALGETERLTIQWLDILGIVHVLYLISYEFVRERIRPWMELATIDALLEDHHTLPFDIRHAMTEREWNALSTHRNLRPGYESWKQMIIEVSHRVERQIDRENQVSHREVTACAQMRLQILEKAMLRLRIQVKRQPGLTSLDELAQALFKLLEEKWRERSGEASEPAAPRKIMPPPSELEITEDTNNVVWAQGQIECGLALYNMLTDDNKENLLQAINCFQDALRIYTEEATPDDWAMTLYHLGKAYCELPADESGENLRQAIDYFQTALRFYTEETAPETWARIMDYLGFAYYALRATEYDQNVQQAIECYHAALRVYTEDATPTDWAMMKSNLGIIYSELPVGDCGENQRLAIACYLDALRVYTEDATPTEWAMVKSHLGFIYCNLASGDCGENQRLAIACFQDVLHVYTKEEFFEDWANVQFNLACAFAALNMTEEALEHLSNSVTSIPEEYRPLAQSEPALQSIHEDPRFMKIIGIELET